MIQLSDLQFQSHLIRSVASLLLGELLTQEVNPPTEILRTAPTQVALVQVDDPLVSLPLLLQNVKSLSVNVLHPPPMQVLLPHSMQPQGRLRPFPLPKQLGELRLETVGVAASLAVLDHAVLELMRTPLRNPQPLSKQGRLIEAPLSLPIQGKRVPRIHGLVHHFPQRTDLRPLLPNNNRIVRICGPHGAQLGDETHHMLVHATQLPS